jgi:Holliday junction resolvase RusA-like endonuclease
VPKKGFTQQDLEKMGLILNKDGTYSRSIVSPYMKQQGFKKVGSFDPIEKFVVKEKVNSSPDFDFKVQTTWFITYNVPSKKNSRQNFVRNGKQISIPSKNHEAYEKMTAMQYSVFGKEFRNTIEKLGLSYPLRVKFTFVRNSKRRFDYCNAVQTVEDLMVKNKWLPDDSADYLLPVFEPYKYDKEKPGVIITI